MIKNKITVIQLCILEIVSLYLFFTIKHLSEFMGVSHHGEKTV